MIDLNDVWQPPARYDLNEVRERLAASAAEWLPSLFPQARLSADRKSLRCADLSGRPPRNEGSCVIHLRGPRAGWGYDHATGESAGPIDLIHHAHRAHATRRCSRRRPGARGLTVRLRLGLRRQRKSTTAMRSRASSPAARRSSGSVAEVYLQSRGLCDPASPDLLFNADLADFETRRGWPGMVARIRNGAGEPTGGIHRTYLLDDGSGKAPPGKKMLGAVAGGSVRLSPVGDDGHLGVAEGIETALAATTIFGIPTWAALSADGVRRWQWPVGIDRVTIFADAGEAGMQAAAVLADRLNIAGIANAIVAPLHGDDFNDDLRHGATAADYQPAEPAQISTPTVLTTASELETAARALTNPPDLTHPRRPARATRHGPTGTLAASARCWRRSRPPQVSRSPFWIGRLARLRKRLHTTGDIHHRPIRPRWANQLRLDLAGTPERNEANVITALSNDEAFAGALVFDEFRQEILVARALPWEQDSRPAASMERCGRCALRRMAATPRHQRWAGHSQPWRQRGCTRDMRASSARLLAEPRLG